MTNPLENGAVFRLEEAAKATGGRLLSPKEGLQTRGICTDTRGLWKGSLFLALRGENFDGHRFVSKAAEDGALAAVVEEGFSRPEGLEDFPLLVVRDSLSALGALAKAHRERFPSLRLGAVTGSNGKTTTKELAASVLEAAFGKTLKTEGNLNNEIGLPLTLLRLDESHRAACVEMGMNRRGEIARLAAIASPRAGAVTCVQAVHLEGLGTIEEVALAKGELYATLPEDGVAVANADDERCLKVAHASGRPLITFGERGADVSLFRIVSHDLRGLSFEVRIRGGEPKAVRLPLVGLHNAQNACAAMALGLALGAEEDEVLLRDATPFPRRLELRAAPGGVTVLDDCYNGNPASAVAALRTARDLMQEGRIHAVLGDLNELGAMETSGHEEVGRIAAEMGVVSLLAFGEKAVSIARGAKERGLGGSEIHETDDPMRALDWLRPRLREGDLVLFKASRGTRLERIADPLVGGN